MIQLLDVYESSGEPRGSVVPYLYKLLAERPHEANISHRVLPKPSDHDAFVRRRPYRGWFMICRADFRMVGSIYATHHNEIGIQVEQDQQRYGYATKAIEALMEKLDPLPVGRGTWLANVAPKNWRSKALFEKKFGGRIIQLTYELPGREEHGKESSSTG